MQWQCLALFFKQKKICPYSVVFGLQLIDRPADQREIGNATDFRACFPLFLENKTLSYGKWRMNFISPLGGGTLLVLQA